MVITCCALWKGRKCRAPARRQGGARESIFCAARLHVGTAHMNTMGVLVRDAARERILLSLANREKICHQRRSLQRRNVHFKRLFFLLKYQMIWYLNYLLTKNWVKKWTALSLVQKLMHKYCLFFMRKVLKFFYSSGFQSRELEDQQIFSKKA